MTDEVPQKQEMALGGVPVSKLATVGGGGSLMVALLFFVNSMNQRVSELTGEVKSLRETVTKVTATLEVVSPSAIREDLRGLEKTLVSKADLAKMAPWVIDRPAWEAWKVSVERRLDKLENK